MRQQFEEFPDDIPAYIRLNVLVEGYLPVMANAEAQQIASRKQCRLCLINAKRKAQPNQSNGYQELTTTEFQKMNPAEVAKMYLEAKGESCDEELMVLFNEVMKGLDDED